MTRQRQPIKIPSWLMMVAAIACALVLGLVAGDLLTRSTQQKLYSEGDIAYLLGKNSGCITVATVSNAVGDSEPANIRITSMYEDRFDWKEGVANELEGRNPLTAFVLDPSTVGDPSQMAEMDEFLAYRVQIGSSYYATVFFCSPPSARAYRDWLLAQR